MLTRLRAALRAKPRAIAMTIGVLAPISASLLWGGETSSALMSPTQVDQAMDLARYGAPVQTGPAGPDSATSFSATLPNGRRITPAGVSIQVGENPLNSVLTPDGKYLIVTNDDERNGDKTNTAYTKTAANGAGQVPGGFYLAVIRTDGSMQVVSKAAAPANPTPHPGPAVPGLSQSDKTSAFFLGLAVKSNGDGTFTVYAAGGPSDVVDVYSLSGAGALSLKTQISIPVPTDPGKPNYGMASPAGLTLSPDGSKLYVVNNNANNVVTVDTATNAVVGNPISVGYFPYMSVLSPDGNTLYVSNWGVTGRSFNAAYTSSYSASSGTGTGSPYIGGVPGHLFTNPTTDNSRSSSVSLVHLGSTYGWLDAFGFGQYIDGIQVVGGTHPSAMAVTSRGGRDVLFVTASNSDDVWEIDARTQQLIGFLPSPQVTPQVWERVMGAVPDALAVSPEGQRLYVAEAGLNAVAVYDLSSIQMPRYLGRIPTGWYPTGVAVSPDGSTLYITNAKGLGSDYGFQGQVSGSPDVNLLFGSVQKVDLAGQDLAAGANQVAQNTVQVMGPGAGLTKGFGNRINHVFFILRENKTYDTYFGDDAVLNGRGANGNPGYATFSAQVPNTRALAERFAVGDNVYADSEESDAGHSFALAGTSTDYQQKTLLSRFARPFINIKNEDPEDYPFFGYIFNNLARQGVSYRNYGDMLRVSGYDDAKNPNHCADDPYPGCNPATYNPNDTSQPTAGLGGLYSENVPALAALGNDHTDTLYPGWNLFITDQRRAKEFMRDMDGRIAAGTVPQFTFIWLPDDHTGSGLDPKFEVSDNDAALGQIVDYLSHSVVWRDSAIFVTEDDAQSSPDHVNAHRTYSMVISPWVKHGLVSHRLSSTVSVPKTIEELLGVPAMNIGDLVANDLADYFTTQPDFTPFTALPQAKPASVPAAAARIAALTARLQTGGYDQDNARLGQLTELYFKADRLSVHRQRMSPVAYRAAQDRLYRVAQAIVAEPAGR